MKNEELKSAAQALKVLFNSFQAAGGGDVEGQAEAYLWAIREYDLVDVQQAVHRFTQGEVAGANPAYCPTTAQLCGEIRERRSMRELLAKREARLSLVKS